MPHPFLDPTRPPPKLLGRGLDAIMEKAPMRAWPTDPSIKARARRYSDALARVGTDRAHENREVRGAELQALFRAVFRCPDAVRPRGEALRRKLAPLIDAIRNPRRRAGAAVAKVLHLRRRHG